MRSTGYLLVRWRTSLSDKEGNRLPINPQLLDKVMKFLAQNGVDAPATAERVDHLASTLQGLDLDLDAVATGRPH